MKLRAECVRDVLLTLEDALEVDDMGQTVPYSTESLIHEPALSKYNSGEILYTVDRLIEGGYLDARLDYLDSRYKWFMEDHGITYLGHNLIASIRPQPVWLSVSRKVAKASGSVSLSLLSTLGEEVLKKFLQESD